jgi:hypothetical protein
MSPRVRGDDDAMSLRTPRETHEQGIDVDERQRDRATRGSPRSRLSNSPDVSRSTLGFSARVTLGIARSAA